MEYAARAEESSGGSLPSGKMRLLQGIDPRVKMAGLLLFVVATVCSHRLAVTAPILTAAVLLAAFSGRPVLRGLYKVWCGVLIFTGIVVMPALFTIPGETLCQLPWIGLRVTVPGFHSALNLLVRAETTATLATLTVLTTRWPHLLKALRVMRMPVVVVVILGITYRYIFLLLQTAADYFEARRTRTVGALSGPQRRHVAGSTAAVLLSKSVQLSNETYEAMQARGFRGEVYTIDEFQMKSRDWLAVAAIVILAPITLWLGSC